MTRIESVHCAFMQYGNETSSHSVVMFRRFASRATIAAFASEARSSCKAVQFRGYFASVWTIASVALLAALLLSTETSYLDILALRKDIAAVITANDSRRAALFCFQRRKLRIQCRLRMAREFLGAVEGQVPWHLLHGSADIGWRVVERWIV